MAALAIAASSIATGADLVLYMDGDTKQIYAEPGANRIRLGAFHPVDETAMASTDNELVVTSASMDIEQRIERSEAKIASLAAETNWTDSFQLRGYLQNRLTTMLGGDEGINLWSDRSVGDDSSLGDADKNFLVRRARVVFLGDVGERMSFYVQPDFASAAGTTGNVVQLRDAYGDVYLTTDRVHRLRVGQSKVPFGFENLQSSANRLALERTDALNSAVKDERDTGMFYYYTPAIVQARFSEMNRLRLKHSGNYGMFGAGVYNGQGANRGDRNDKLHAVIRLDYPWRFGNGQFFEASLQAYSGSYVVTTAPYQSITGLTQTPVVSPDNQSGYDDKRIGAAAIWYPQPFGVQVEWNWGRAPSLDLATNSIGEAALNGGYVQTMFKLEGSFGALLPFARWQYFNGANKAELNAPANSVNDIEIGLEWQPNAELELSTVYHRLRRTNLVTGNRAGRADYQDFEAQALRLQLQYTYE